MAVSIAADVFTEDQIAVLDSLLTDLTNARTAITNITAKLDADTGVADTNYAATTNPAALGTTV